MIRGEAVGVLAVLAGVALLMISPIDDADLWWLLAGGRHMVETRVFPTTDPFSATAAGAEWINHAWGFQLLLYAVHRAGGLTGLIGLQVAFAAATFALLYRGLRAEGLAPAGALALVVLGALATRGFWAPRPQIVTYLFLAVFWLAFRRWRAGQGDRLTWLVLLTAVWVNLHGGFLVGPALLALGFLGEAAERLVRGGPASSLPDAALARLCGVGVACGGAMLLSPFHYRAVGFALKAAGTGLGQEIITEWASPPFDRPQVWLLEGLIMAALALLWLSPARARWSEILVLVTFVHLGLQAIRNTPLLVIVLLPILGRLLAEVLAAPGPVSGTLAWLRRRRLAAAALLTLAAGVGGALLPTGTLAAAVPRLGLAPDTFPVEAVRALQRLEGPDALFNDYYWGGYLIWHLYPRYRVSVDGRAAVYGPQRLAEHLEVANLGPRWRETLDRSGLRLALIRARSPLARALAARPDWQLLHEDGVAVLFARRASAP